ncbi:hypothetical protein GGI15_002211 [Coemansia interrupta]|uniref:Protein kinase domain-containing protein n=1 Tax=Coemansia interrupta TaxID=1126814 RepID=A0A9W8LJS1_9FUNG|nr:hypothetical protein GGI15_002211 [Coemansia interrupta]
MSAVAKHSIPAAAALNLSNHEHAAQSVTSNVRRHTSTSSSNSASTLFEESMLNNTQHQQHPSAESAPSSQKQLTNGVSAAVAGMVSMKLEDGEIPPIPCANRSRRSSTESVTSTSSVAQAIAATANASSPRIEKRPSLMQRFLGTGHKAAHKQSQSPPAPSSVKSAASSTPMCTTFEQKYGTCSRECIGRGATAVVRVAFKQHRDGPQMYAIKRFRKQTANETERDYIKKLTSEYCISSSIHHKNVVSTLDLIQDAGKNWCQVMEYCPGGDLYTVIRDGNMGLVEDECCFKQMCEGIANLHSMGVCHRDIKAENMLLDARNTIKITDFGVADVFRVAWEERIHKSRGLCGSEPYIAPEMFTGKSYDGRKVDVWSAAIVYYTMVYNGIPWRVAKEDDSNYSRFLDAMRNGRDYEGFRRIDPKTRRLIQSMLNPDPQARPTMEEVMQSDIMKRIVVCDDEGNVPGSGHHCHYTDEYEERKNSRSMRAQAAAALAGAAHCRVTNH